MMRREEAATKKMGNFDDIFKFTVASSRCLFVNPLNKTPI
jgi:hypothetical protein